MGKKKKYKGTLEKEAFLRKLGVVYAKELIARATSWELEFRDKLDKAGIPYIFQYPVVCERNYLYILDFYIPDYNVAFELDGAHHAEKNKQKADTVRSRRVKALGIHVKRIKNMNVKFVTPQMLHDFLKAQKDIKKVC